MPIARIIDNVEYPRFTNPHTQRLAYEFNGNLYCILRDDVVPLNPFIRAYRSNDGGFTSVELDGANAPTCAGSLGVCWDGSTGHVFYQQNGTNQLEYIPLDLITGTWGVPNISPVNLGLGGHAIYAVLRSTGEFIVCYNQPATGEVDYIGFNAGIWGAAVQVSGTPGETAIPRRPNGLLVDQATDTIHFFYTSSSLFFGNYTQYHRGMSALNVIDGRQDLFTAPAATSNGPILGVPTIWGGNIALPYNLFIGVGPVWNVWILYGTTAGMTSPVWTTEQVDNTQPASNTGLVGGNTVTFAQVNAAGDLMVWWTTVYNPFLTNKLFYSIRLGGVWGAPVAFFDLTVDPNPDPTVANQFLHDVAIVNRAVGGFGVLVSAEAGLNPGTGMPYCSSFWLLAGPPPPVVPPVISHGGFRRMVVLVPNRFDMALAMDLKAHRERHPQRPCPDAMLYRNINWVRAPANYLPFRKVGTVPTPLAVTGDVVVLDFQVPEGYDGVIAGLFHRYTGPGFLEGNGDLQWRILINRVYAIHLGNVQVSLGNQQQPYPIDGGIYIQSGNRIRYIVNAPNLSGGILPLASRIVCGLEGLFYARA